MTWPSPADQAGGALAAWQRTFVTSRRPTHGRPRGREDTAHSAVHIELSKRERTTLWRRFTGHLRPRSLVLRTKGQESVLTRIILAQSTDMGTKYVDKSQGNLGTDVHYGETGTVIRYKGGKGMPARSHEIEARRTNALQYTGILDDEKKVVNEVVVEYRKHASGKFPLFTEIDHKNKQFHILDPSSFQRTGRYIDNQGREH
jgi:hypothetical protein